MTARRLLLTGLLMAAMIAAALSGCAPAGHTESVLPQGVGPYAEAIKMGNALSMYMQIKGHPPASKRDLQQFCSRSGLPCRTLDWRRFSWKSVNDTEVTVVYKYGTSSVPIVVGKDSVSVTDMNTMQDDKLKDDELKERLERLMNDPNGQH
jgi:hypothetical protein